MSAMAATPAIVALGTGTGTSMTVIHTGPASAAEEGFYDVRLTNYGAAAATGRVVISPDGGTTIGELLFDKTLAPGESLDVARALPLPYGWKIMGRSGLANTLRATATGVKRAVA